MKLVFIQEVVRGVVRVHDSVGELASLEWLFYLRYGGTYIYMFKVVGELNGDLTRQWVNNDMSLF